MELCKGAVEGADGVFVFCFLFSERSMSLPFAAAFWVDGMNMRERLRFSFVS